MRIKLQSSLIIVALFLLFDGNLTAQTTYTSTSSGNWSTMTWSPAGNPGTLDNVIIPDGDTVYYDAAATISSLTVGQGVSGMLKFDTTTIRTLTISGNLTVRDSAVFKYTTSSTSLLHSLVIGGNISLGTKTTFTVGTSSTAGVGITFNKAVTGDQTISSTGIPLSVTFGFITLNRPNNTDRVVCSITNLLKAGGSTFTLTKGTFEQTAGTMTLSASANIVFAQDNGSLVLSGSGSAVFTKSIGGATNGFIGTITVNTSGSLTVGSANGDSKIEVGGATGHPGTLNLYSGTLLINGRLQIDAVTGTLNMTGGVLNIDPQSGTGGVNSTSSSAFNYPSGGGNTANISGGVITILNPGLTGTGKEVTINSSSVFNMTGGRFVFGSGASTKVGTASGYETTLGNHSLYNVEINSGTVTVNLGAPVRTSTGTSNLICTGDLILTSGTLNANITGVGSSNIDLSGNWINNGGIFVPGSTTIVTFKGTSTQTVSNPLQSFQKIVVNNSNGVTFNSNISFNDTLKMTSGKINTGAYTLSLGTTGFLIENPTKYVLGTTTVTRSVGTGASTLSGIGVSLDAGGGDNLGNVSVTRVAGTGISVQGSTGINRYWTITSDNPPALGRNLTLAWDTLDINGRDMSTAQVWNSTDGGTTWASFGTSQSVNSGNPSITIPVTSFSKMTVVDATHPLPVELTSFSASRNSGIVNLKWSTSVEIKNIGFEIQRQSAGSASSWEKIGFVKGAGNSSSVKMYSYSDKGFLSPGKYQYRLNQIDQDGRSFLSKTIEVNVSLPQQYSLNQNYPNPFNPTTIIEYSLPKAGNVELTLYNSIGQIVSRLAHGYQEAGNYSVKFDGLNCSTGVYFYQLKTAEYTSIKKMILVK